MWHWGDDTSKKTFPQYQSDKKVDKSIVLPSSYAIWIKWPKALFEVWESEKPLAFESWFELVTSFFAFSRGMKLLPFRDPIGDGVV